MTKSSVKSVSVALFATAMFSVLGFNTAFAVVISEVPTTPTITVIAESIVCDNASDLPVAGWGGFGPITSTTASTFLASHETCHVAGNWSYQYGDQNSTNPGDTFVGEAAGFTTFGSTDSNGLTSTVITLTSPNNDGVFAPIHLREVLQDGYLPFTFEQVGGNTDNNSPKFGCSDDAYNNDNFDWINTPVNQGTFYCVSWNVQKPAPQVCAEGTTGTYPECVPVTPVTPPTTGSTGGSTNYDYYGCTNASASNFNSLANKDDGSCIVAGGTGGSVGGNGGSTGSSTGSGTQGEVLGASTTTEPILPAGCSAYLTDYLKQGKNNDKAQVVLLQQFLNDYMGAKIPTNGFFGTLTKSWVKKFQVKHHAEIIKPWYDAGYTKKDIENGTGYVYKTTKYEINVLKCSNNLTEKAPDLTPDLGK